MSRVILIVLDSVGAGASDDAALYGDEGCNTLLHVDEACGGLRLPALERLGLGSILAFRRLRPGAASGAAYGRMKEQSAGKDTTSGHWEMMGLVQKQPFPTFPGGFPAPLIKSFEQAIGRPVLGNKAASGTVIIEELGPAHLATGYPIVYTSADSVFQIAAHEDIIPVEELYEMCRLARRLLTGEYAVGRVIARPFAGSPGSFVRPPRRHDFALEPPRNLLDILVDAGLETWGIGKIPDIFAGRGIQRALGTTCNVDGIDRIREAMENCARGLIFANLIDFDQLYGHRNDAPGYGRALEEFDARLPLIMEMMKPADMLVITADHGCDPAFPGTDHTREEVPLLVYAPWITGNRDLGLRSSFADIARTIGDFFQLDCSELAGESFLSEIQGEPRTT